MYQQIMVIFLPKNALTLSPKYAVKSVLNFFMVAIVTLFLSACVTQEYKEDNTPVIANDANNKEIAMTRVQLGLGYLKIGNTTQAKLNLEKAKRSAPNLVQVYTAFAHYYDTVGEVEQAIAAYEKALLLKSDDADTLNNYGVFLCRQGRVADAEKQLLKAIAVPTYLLVSQSYENIALCQLKNNDFEKAEEYLNKSIQHSPNNVSALVQMTKIQYAKGNYQEAEQYIRRFEKATRRFKPAPLALSFKVYKKQGKTKVANNYAAMLVKMFPQSFQTKQFLVNELAHIEADTLAEKYQQSIASSTAKVSQKKKRVIKLSPHKLIAPQKPKENITSEISQSIKVEKKTVLTAPQVVTKVDSKQNEVEQNKNTVVLTTIKFDKVDETASTNQNTVKPEEQNDKASIKVGTESINKTQTVQKEGNAQLSMTLPVHVVGSGESLFYISKKYNIRMPSLKRWNHLKKNPVLHIGDVIYLTDPKNAVNP